jgi:maltodextrin utilization protein YvdJ
MKKHIVVKEWLMGRKNVLIFLVVAVLSTILTICVMGSFIISINPMFFLELIGK